MMKPGTYIYDMILECTKAYNSGTNQLLILSGKTCALLHFHIFGFEGCCVTVFCNYPNLSIPF